MMKVGVLGSGQLALLMAKASHEAQVSLSAFGPQSSTILQNHCLTVQADFSDTNALQAFADSVDVLTFETENIPEHIIEHEWLKTKLLPNAESLLTFQNRFLEKNCFIDHGASTTQFAPVFNASELSAAARSVDFPAILKTNLNGYDGRGQRLVNSLNELEKAWQEFNYTPCILESVVNFEEEISIVAVRDCFGTIVCYPVSRNVHRHGQIRLALVTGNHPLQTQAEQLISHLMQKINYIGCMTMEFFVKDNKLIVNEVAPRVHNSGHWSIDASNCSQFTNHLRAISGQQVIRPVTNTPTAMINLIGSIPAVSVQRKGLTCQTFDYGKTWKPERKVGHINLVGNPDSAVFFQALVETLEELGERELAISTEHYAQHFL